ncbi:hypothetical protein RD792_002251 [Penstemon davidsonii]|uniref:Glutamyl/glutaminyl-tRNA synthetase class Ib catalytic domain-containing protein n=1 Tax=Penstemon davidsonii TaxID=160366 RepID=A0ABR0DRL2_9LAMI|nr:hypothetical protein RD792_002251 [Penstemon davidsonii]
MEEIVKLKQQPPVYTGSGPLQQIQKSRVCLLLFLVTFGSDPNGDFYGNFILMYPINMLDDIFPVQSEAYPAEEHLPNTLRQALIYKALGFPMPQFAHVSLNLATDKSKLSKRHGATSVGQLKMLDVIIEVMPRFLTWFAVSKFTIQRVNRSGAVFFILLKRLLFSTYYNARWMNGQHLRSLPSDNLTKLIGERWKSIGILMESSGPFIEEAVQLLKDGIDLITDADKALSNLFSYPLYATLASPEGKVVLEDKLSEVATSLVAAYDSGELSSALEEGHSQVIMKDMSFFLYTYLRFPIQGKSLFMPHRVLLTGKRVVYKAGRCVVVSPQSGFVTLDDRIKMLREIEWQSLNKDDEPVLDSVVAV